MHNEIEKDRYTAKTHASGARDVRPLRSSLRPAGLAAHETKIVLPADLGIETLRGNIDVVMNGCK